ncbi:MAG: hypothetical protein EAZ53_16050 [Bacteroidetes bacterium]|nr:MAG: hypothetical protein EAZ53_16050 [Bacteroidota bacterium]
MNLSTLSIDKTNYLNVFLMLFSLVLAYFYPFELFLVSFVFFGPLHYLTEISWLEKKDFFIRIRTNIFLLISIVLVICIYYFFPLPQLVPFINSILFCSLFLAAAMAFTNNIWYILLSFAAAFALVFGANWHEQDWFLIVFTIFLPTIIHITIFTGLFILSGIRKNNNLSGWASIICFVFCTFFFFISPFNNSTYQVTGTAQTLYFDFIVLNKKFADFFHFGELNRIEDIFESQKGIIIMQFIAFSYTYHYLNWFTKTSVIKWHEISQLRMWSILVIHAAIMGLFFYYKELGISILTLLSMAHLVFEFPLNALSLKSLFTRNV